MIKRSVFLVDDERCKEIQERINVARKNAHKMITFSQETIPKEVHSGSVTFNLLVDFITGLLSCNFSEERVTLIVEHENDHKSVADSFGICSVYRIDFVFDLSTNKRKIQPCMMYHSDADIPVEERNKIEIAIASAPTKLGKQDLEDVRYFTSRTKQ